MSDYELNRSVFINAHPQTVFGFFEDSTRWAAWWGAGSTIEPRVGGKVYVRYPNAVEASGEVIEIDSPKRLVFSYGYHTEGTDVPPGSSRVTITLAREASGTRLTLTHVLPTEKQRDEHTQGWRYQLSVFANTVADAALPDLNAMVDTWFEAWAETDAAKRDAMFTSVSAADVHFGDRYGVLDGIEEISLHAGAAQKFMPGVKLTRKGNARHTLGTVLVEWEMPLPGGNGTSSGWDVFDLNAERKFSRVVGLWN